MRDLTTRLAEALDRAEREARAGHSDAAPDMTLRLVARDRALLARHRATFGEDDCRVCAHCPDRWPCADLRAAAGFWLPEEATR